MIVTYTGKKPSFAGLKLTEREKLIGVDFIVEVVLYAKTKFYSKRLGNDSESIRLKTQEIVKPHGSAFAAAFYDVQNMTGKQILREYRSENGCDYKTGEKINFGRFD
jgi:hypothetical protein